MQRLTRYQDVTTFSLYMGKALTKLREREAVVEKDKEPPSLYAHQQGRRDGGYGMERLPDVIPGHPRLADSSGTAFNACSKC